MQVDSSYLAAARSSFDAPRLGRFTGEALRTPRRGTLGARYAVPLLRCFVFAGAMSPAAAPPLAEIAAPLLTFSNPRATGRSPLHTLFVCG